MGRTHTAADPGQAILAGKLGDALRMHAAQRIHYFFTFLFAAQALVDRLNARNGLGLHAVDAVSPKATHQIATGLRSGDAAYYDFQDRDPKIVDQAATACGRMDAAHYCNLGIKPDFLSLAAPHAKPGEDDLAFRFLELLEVMAGATRQLPQRVNIGPDRIVDQLHGDLATRFLNGGPPVGPANLSTYAREADAAMAAYQAQHLKAKTLGLAACCQCYLDVYRRAPAIAGAWSLDGVAAQLRGMIDAECGALGLDRARYWDAKVA